ncbi:MAG TPA: hypothetical protein VEH31_03945 [Streptosporangiaceae bacterium]|nr:hypothetical protein [Streptosporangiaceae bacterium]
MSKRESILASIGSDLVAEVAGADGADGQVEPGAVPPQKTQAVPDERTETRAGEGGSDAQAELRVVRERLLDAEARLAQLAPLDAAARDPDRYLIERFGIKGLRHGRPMTVRLPVHLDEGLDRYVGGSRVRTRTALVLALLDAYLNSAGLATGGELTVNR